MRTKYRVHIGFDPNSFHSLRDFPNLTDAIAYMWAMVNVPYPQKCWLWQGMDGWLRNDHMKEQPLPDSLKEKIEFFINEDLEITTKEMD